MQHQRNLRIKRVVELIRLYIDIDIDYYIYIYIYYILLIHTNTHVYKASAGAERHLHGLRSVAEESLPPISPGANDFKDPEHNWPAEDLQQRRQIKTKTF